MGGPTGSASLRDPLEAVLPRDAPKASSTWSISHCWTRSRSWCSRRSTATAKAASTSPSCCWAFSPSSGCTWRRSGGRAPTRTIGDSHSLRRSQCDVRFLAQYCEQYRCCSARYGSHMHQFKICVGLQQGSRPVYQRTYASTRPCSHSIDVCVGLRAQIRTRLSALTCRVSAKDGFARIRPSCFPHPCARHTRTRAFPSCEHQTQDTLHRLSA